METRQTQYLGFIQKHTPTQWRTSKLIDERYLVKSLRVEETRVVAELDFHCKIINYFKMIVVQHKQLRQEGYMEGGDISILM